MNLYTLLSKIDFRLTGDCYSRPQKQVRMLVDRLTKGYKKRFGTILDIGGGFIPQYKLFFTPISDKYLNLEIHKSPQVDIVGSVYDVPMNNNSVDVISMMMVMEHLNEPKKALHECHRVLKKSGFLLITTVQYWHTHNHPSDYLRYTKAGLTYYCNQVGLKVVDIWSMGGPFLVIFHSIELNLPESLRTIYSIIFYKLFDWLDWLVFRHEDKRKYSDSVGWSLIAQKL